MEIAIAAFLLTEWDMKVNHKKSSENRSSNVLKYFFLVSVTSNVDEVIKIIT